MQNCGSHTISPSAGSWMGLTGWLSPTRNVAMGEGSHAALQHQAMVILRESSCTASRLGDCEGVGVSRPGHDASAEASASRCLHPSCTLVLRAGRDKGDA